MFHEDSVHHTFGIMSRKGYKALSDFTMEFVHHIVCRDPFNNGFVVKVTPERYSEDSSDGDHWQERWVILFVSLFFLVTLLPQIHKSSSMVQLLMQCREPP